MKYALLVDYDYCTGCHACEVACNQEHDFSLGLSGMKVFESVVTHGDRCQVNYMPVRTDLCSFCARRIKKGKRPACVQHCLAGCLEVGNVEELADSFKTQRSKKMLLI
jgi:Fe-S-cluster-containing dehydrogenase component